ncbi:hypothetical protein LCGC14_1510180 [marine sediment metagenome]|uniref:Uncharacterized protein n=1 Tax=marine sediment metagenome TaxID=412755 RepID=A0A0F9J1W4_9ZZZZ
MNREITKRLLDGFDKLCPHNMSRGPGPICDECWVIWGAEEIERLLADEREKVREMCCSLRCGNCEANHELFTVDGHYFHRVPVYGEDNKTVVKTRSGLCLADAVRQLDLTKELAGSSAEEGGDAK